MKKLLQMLGRKRWFARIMSHVIGPVDKALHRLSGGRFRFTELLMPTLILTSTGRKSGAPRNQPLTFMLRGDAWVVVGTNFGGEHHPAWTYNLLADPNATVEFDGQTHRVVARQLSEDEMAPMWPKFQAVWPGYADYRVATTRDIRMFELTAAS